MFTILWIEYCAYFTAIAIAAGRNLANFLSLVLIFVALSNFGSLPIKISTMVAPKNKDSTNLFITIH